MGIGYKLYMDDRRLAIFVCNNRFVFEKSSWVVYGQEDENRIGAGYVYDGNN